MPSIFPLARNKLRPQLNTDQSAYFSYDNVLDCTGPAGEEYSQPWDPASQVNTLLAEFTKPCYCVDSGLEAETATRFPSVQAAINQAILDRQHQQSNLPIIIQIAPGVYEGLVYIPSLTVDRINVVIRLYGQDKNPENTILTANIDAEMSGAEYQVKFAAQFDGAPRQVYDLFSRISTRKKITTANASVVRVENEGFFAANLTLHNSYNADRVDEGNEGEAKSKGSDFQQSTGQHQAVALMIAGADKVHCENLHLKSYQDTLYLQSFSENSGTRSYFNRCTIEGDVDFIFGQSIAYFTQCTIKSLGSRTPHSWVTAPSTNIRSRYGFVFNDCDFTHDNSPNALLETFSLGRQWFEGVKATPYGAPPIPDYQCKLAKQSHYNEPHGSISPKTLSAVGKCIIMNSRIGKHINHTAPWDDWNGGSYTRDGIYHAGLWTPRFRPAQFTAGDLNRHLAKWLSSQNIDYSDIDPSDALLAEYQNESVSL